MGGVGVGVRPSSGGWVGWLEDGITIPPASHLLCTIKSNGGGGGTMVAHEKNAYFRFKLYSVPRILLFRKFVANIVGLPGHRNKRKSVLEITKLYSF